MNTRIFSALATFATLFVSSTALAWSVPIHLCSFPSEPAPGPIPCSYTNEDGQTFNGVVTSTGGNVLCTGMVAPTPDDATEAASIDELYESFGESRDEAPMCGVHPTPKGALLECPIDGDEGGWTPTAMVKVCGPGWCHELASYVDCADYNSTEIQFDDVTCYDLT